LKQLIGELRQLAGENGIDVLRVTTADPFPDYAWAKSVRRDPRLSLPAARSIVVCGIYIGGHVLPGRERPEQGRASRLVLAGYYADVVEPVESLARHLRAAGYRALTCGGGEPEKSIVPLKLAAVRAGIGWQGKSSLLVTKEYGTFLALGGIVTEAPLPPDHGEAANGCGNCNACRQACPVGALHEPYRLDYRRCLSFTAEQAILSGEAQRAIGNRVLECDVCQEACPWNRRHLQAPLPTVRTREFAAGAAELAAFWRLEKLFDLTEAEYDATVGKLRTGIPYPVFRRNVAAALGHAGTERASAMLRVTVADPDPEVSRVARVALAGRLGEGTV